jgi:hypothetical protein
MAQQFGFRAANSLSEILDRNRAWDNLGISRNDLPLLVDTAAAGITSADYFAIAGLRAPLEDQINASASGATVFLAGLLGKVKKNGDTGVGTILAQTVNNDRPYANAANSIFAPSVESFFSPPSASGFSQGGEYKLGTVTADTTTVSGFNYQGITPAWNNFFVRYKRFLTVKEEPSWDERLSPLYLPSPVQIEGNVLWLDSEYSPVVQEGGAVRRWEDVLGRGRASQESSANRPLFVENSLNGKPAVVFDGNNDFLSFGNISSLFPTGATVIIVAALGEPSARGDSDYNLLGTLNNASNRWRTGTGNGNFGLFTSTLRSGFPERMPANGTFVFSVRASQVFGLELRINGRRQGLLNNAFAPTITYNPGSVYTLGANAGGTAGFLGGSMFAVAFFNRTLDLRELNTMEEYFKWRYDFSFDPDRSQPIELENGQSLLLEDGSPFVFG